MILKKLSLLNFKNYSEITLDFSDTINCIAGNNGSGKTNILDAIHYLALCKSYFNPTDSQHIKKGQPFFVIQGEFLLKGETEAIFCGLKTGQKKVFKRNQTEYDKLSEHIGLLPVVKFKVTIDQVARTLCIGKSNQLFGVILVKFQKLLNHVFRVLELSVRDRLKGSVFSNWP